MDQIQDIIRDICEEMDAKGTAYGKVRQGVMIETPAADRQNYKVSSLCSSSHPAVIRMMEFAVKSAHRYGLPITVCGEMASDTGMTKKLVEMGVDILSVAPGQVLSIRKEIRNTTVRG